MDIARTLRRGIAHNGIMFHTCWRQQRRDKAQVLTVCDVSGSVAIYARFLSMFLYSLQDIYYPKSAPLLFQAIWEKSAIFSRKISWKKLLK
ncbi:MAG: VWA domain-containing protein [Parahaliea sp.]